METRFNRVNTAAVVTNAAVHLEISVHILVLSAFCWITYNEMELYMASFSGRPACVYPMVPKINGTTTSTGKNFVHFFFIITHTPLWILSYFFHDLSVKGISVNFWLKKGSTGKPAEPKTHVITIAP
jgi:hypothetical protein